MRLFQHSLVALLLVSFVGCEGDSKPQTVDTSEIERYVTDNPEAVARQAELSGAEDEDDEDE